MKLYALRDRMLAYFLRPFVADSHFQVLASLSETINSDKETTIQAAPHHFELWCLAEIDEETGRVTGTPEFLQDCAGLVRERIRPRGESAGQPPSTPTRRAQGAPGDREGGTAPTGAAARNGALTTALAAPENDPRSGGSTPLGALEYDDV